MRFTRTIIYHELSYIKFSDFIKAVQEKYSDEQVIGYRTLGKEQGRTKVEITFSKK